MFNGQYYIGSTPDLARRMGQHKSGQVISTKGKLPHKLVFHRSFSTLTEARSIEYKLKRYKNKNIIRQIVTDQRIQSLGS